MIERDQQYQKRKRPGRAEGDDVHESILREYIPGGKLKASDHLLQVRDNIKEELKNPLPFISTRLNELREAWETNHPGQKFFDEEYHLGERPEAA